MPTSSPTAFFVKQFIFVHNEDTTASSHWLAYLAELSELSGQTIVYTKRNLLFVARVLGQHF